MGILRAGARPYARRMTSRPRTSRRSARDRIERLCGAGLTPKTLRERVLAALRPVLEYDAHVWLLTDPVTRVGTSHWPTCR